MRFVNRILASTTLLIGMLLVSPSSLAGDIEVTVNRSFSNNISKTGVGVRFGPWWNTSWGSWHASISPEIEVNHFSYDGDRKGRDSLNQIGGIAQFRLDYGSDRVRPFFQLGLGGGYFSHTQIGGKSLSTRFQFSEHITFGAQIDRISVGMRYSHYSNAGIKRPNDGLDMFQFFIGARF